MSLQITSERFGEAFAKMEVSPLLQDPLACANPLWIQAALSANELRWSHSRNKKNNNNKKKKFRRNFSANDRSAFSEGEETQWSKPAVQASIPPSFSKHALLT